EALRTPIGTGSASAPAPASCGVSTTLPSPSPAQGGQGAVSGLAAAGGSGGTSGATPGGAASGSAGSGRARAGVDMAHCPHTLGARRVGRFRRNAPAGGRVRGSAGGQAALLVVR